MHYIIPRKECDPLATRCRTTSLREHNHNIIHSTAPEGTISTAAKVLTFCRFATIDCGPLSVG